MLLTIPKLLRGIDARLSGFKKNLTF